MKRICSIVLMLVLVVGFVTAAGAQEDDGKMKIFMSSAYYTAPYGAPLQEAVREKAAELGYDVQIVDGEQNADKQLSQFKAAVADGYDALIYWPGDQASTPPLVEYLNSTGKPWVALNTVVADSVIDQVPCMIASDEVEIGRWLGRLMIKYFEDNP